ncbi:unnamed protein product [Acanthoscelides obtectus]|uniref:Uncharacterized protein n=1 Tax=Acanthoscelides obtectus TaxID=200917 RepID=A0A9P0P8T7_ACAOB|nr:unnamed protein product [Acanthoscelides obtectus]CAK1631777.1 hypothetical protein AOBTE_LOCUS7153 [Acanthoscelides obtectus]
MEFSEKDVQEAQVFGEFYIDKMENHRNTLQYYLCENVVLDWFGKTVKGDKTVSAFLKKTLASVNHIMTDAVPVKKIGFRDTHVVNVPKEPKFIPMGLMTPPRICHQKMLFKTPKKQNGASTSSLFQPKENNKEKGQGDGIHNLLDVETSPVKKFKASNGDPVVSNLELVESECDLVMPQVKYVLMDGAIEFHKPSSKKLQSETKWKRPSKLSVAYSKTNCEYTIYLIIYEGNVKCRRNLLKEFEEEEPEN